jgi:hypothetical protein
MTNTYDSWGAYQKDYPEVMDLTPWVIDDGRVRGCVKAGLPDALPGDYVGVQTVRVQVDTGDLHRVLLHGRRTFFVHDTAEPGRPDDLWKKLQASAPLVDARAWALANGFIEDDF